MSAETDTVAATTEAPPMAAGATSSEPEPHPTTLGESLPVAEGGGVLSPLSGSYLLIILSEPISDAHKGKMMQKLRQGKQELQKNNAVELFFFRKKGHARTHAMLLSAAATNKL